jgi:ion channel
VRALAAVAGLAGILLILWDAFVTVLLPRRVSGAFHPGRSIQAGLWRLVSAWARRIELRRRREEFLSPFAMLLMLTLFGVWAAGLVVGFALLEWGLGSHLEYVGGGSVGFGTDLYMSGTTFFTLGLGDVHPTSHAARAITVIEAGMGFGFLAMVIAYLPVLYQAFSRREARIAMLDEWAGSPPTPATLLARAAHEGELGAVAVLLREWEQVAAELLESHLSYSILAYFRSQHDNQSWLAALTTVLDTSTIVIAGVQGMPALQAQLTFAMARHALVDLCQVLRCRPVDGPDRLPADDLQKLRVLLDRAGLRLHEGGPADHQIAELRAMYEPYARALADHLVTPLPAWLPPARGRFNWETTAWARTGHDLDH